jgi:hypothetical protein
VLVALVLLATVATGTPVAPTAAPGPAASTDSTTPVVDVRNTTGYLTFADADAQTSQFGNATLNVASASAVDSGRFGDRLVGAAQRQAFESAPNETARTQALETAAATYERRIEALEQRQAQAIRRYDAGELSTAGFLQEMAVVDERARDSRRSVTRLLDDATNQPSYSVPVGTQTRLESLQATPNILSGPVRERAALSVTGTTGRERIYIETSTGGIVLTHVSGNDYVREVFLADAYNRSEESEFSIDAAFDRARSLYPWADENRITTPSADGYGNTAVYRISIDHTQGSLVTFIDGSTREVFREVQEKRLESIPVTGTVSTTTDGLSLTVNETHENGPVEVRTTDPATGDPVDARIRLDGQYVGSTGSTGHLWTAIPPETTVVNATASDGRAVEVAVTPG